ncbi:MAG: hypothetical protein KDG89_12300, partial [Geminicoccaceae bacterium]|nr:hypothetical protein [Geminicoccaceae bacterium]
HDIVDWIKPYLIVCVSYDSVFNGNHQTGFIYEIVRLVHGASNARIGPSAGDIPLNELILREWRKPARID